MKALFIGLAVSFVFFVSFEALAASVSLNRLCEVQAERAIEKAFAEDGWRDLSVRTEIIGRQPASDGFEKLEISILAYIPGPYDGSKRSVYEILVKVDTKKLSCELGQPILILDEDIAD